MYNLFYSYDYEVIEFFNTIIYFGGKVTICFIRGFMNFQDGKDSYRKRIKEKEMNLGGFLELVYRKYQVGYILYFGVIKVLFFVFIDFVKDDGEIVFFLKFEIL